MSWYLFAWSNMNACEHSRIACDGSVDLSQDFDFGHLPVLP